MPTYTEQERRCEREFEIAGPFWHLYTNGRKMEDFLCEEEFKTVMTALAITAMLSPEVRIITF